VMDHQEAITAISVKAVQEAALVELLDKVRNMWVSCDFTLLAYKDQKDVYILSVCLFLRCDAHSKNF